MDKEILYFMKGNSFVELSYGKVYMQLTGGGILMVKSHVDGKVFYEGDSLIDALSDLKHYGDIIIDAPSHRLREGGLP